ncbi:hypothetical protein IF1G_11110 [Cordyceps javanica]|uniref:Uncharacterized protein n=1 Tax=Cordyceps javanica TaxID=43265 RepID=A0A545UL75_9HYPO|nr:hypothetical protein IF1G_11110 [Cordyceps javanica]
MPATACNISSPWDSLTLKSYCRGLQFGNMLLYISTDGPGAIALSGRAGSHEHHMVRDGDTPPFTMHLNVSSLEFISTFVARGVGDMYIATCFIVAILAYRRRLLAARHRRVQRAIGGQEFRPARQYERRLRLGPHEAHETQAITGSPPVADHLSKSILLEIARFILAFATLVPCAIAFGISPPEAQLRKYICIKTLQGSGALCTCSEPVTKTVFGVSLVSALVLLGVGAWRYATTGSQWLWYVNMILGAMPASVSAALGSKLVGRREQTLRRLIVSEGWVVIPAFLATGLAVAACIVSNTQTPELHSIQFSVQFLLGLSPTAVRDIRRELRARASPTRVWFRAGARGHMKYRPLKPRCTQYLTKTKI